MISYCFDAKGYYREQLEDYGFAPNNSTHQAPDFVAGFIPRWDGSTWNNVENHKHEQGYLNGKPYTVTEYGPLPTGFTKERPAADLLEAAAVLKLSEIEAGYQQALAASLTMPKADPSTSEVAIGAALFAAEDAESLEYLTQVHQAKRQELIALVAQAQTLEDVEAIQVSYAV